MSSEQTLTRPAVKEQAVSISTTIKKPSTIWSDIGAQLFLLFLSAVVLFPLLWVLAMALDPRDITRPDSLIPPGASLASFQRLFTQPQANGVYVIDALKNSLMVAGGTALLAAVIGATAGYAFSRFKFPGRQAGMLSFIVVQMMPAGATLAPLFVILSLINIGDFNLRKSLIGLAIAYGSGALPFVIWNLKGYFDTIPKDLEEAALIDGAGPLQAFLRVVLPLSLPAFAVTLLFSFLAGWSEYLMAWTFLSDPDKFTLPMLLAGMVGQFSSNTRWSDFAALSIVMSLPVLVLFFMLQKWIVSGLTLGGVKG
jgi:arabinogalactan oligomer / maltooligosaccharide transport system permease protein